MGLNTRERGQAIEQQACAHLAAQGLTLQEANYRCKHGEIDLIMVDSDELAFIEVRYRRQSDYGDGAASINVNKRRKLIKTASHYLVSIDKYDKIPCRFDVVDVRGSEGNYQLDWIKDAFPVTPY